MSSKTIKQVEVKQRPNIIVGVESDGFTVIVMRGEEEELNIRIDQEDDPGIGLTEIFEHLGYDVLTEEWY